MNAKYMILLAAGHSSRMGTSKALLPFSETENFMQHLLHEFLAFPFEKIICVVSTDLFALFNNADTTKNSRIFLIENPNPEKGRFYSLQLGLSQCIESHVFVHNIDNPFVCSELIYQLDDALKAYDFIYPVFNNKGGHPLLISSQVVKKIKENCEISIPLNVFLSKFKGLRFETLNQQILININTINDYHAIFKTTGK